jgi:GxxExxY protein
MRKTPTPLLPYVQRRSTSLKLEHSDREHDTNTFNSNYYKENRWAYALTPPVESLSKTTTRPISSPSPEPNPEPNPGPRLQHDILHETRLRQVAEALILRMETMPHKRIKTNHHTPPPPCYYDRIIALAHEVFQQYGTGYTERVYQEGIYFSAYKENIPCLMERCVHVTHDNIPLAIGKVDLEVASRYVFELKISAYNATNLKKDTLQIEKYLRAYAMNKQTIHKAALIYFTPSGVRVVQIDPFRANDVEVDVSGSE